MASQNMELDAVKMRRRTYYRVFVCGSTILGDGPEELPDREFTYKIITGKRDRNMRVWYGLVRPMLDPQRWLNQFLSQILAILAASTKGGVLYEEGAVGDIKAFEKSWAQFGGNTSVNPGALSGGEIMPKPSTPYPAGIERLLQMSTDALRESTGVNPEMLGMVDRDQAGVLEHQRKQAAYGILANFFDSFRRYRRVQGRLMLKYISLLPADYLVRIVKDDGLAEYVPILQADHDTGKFDVIVDEAPAGPNQKAQVWGMIMQLMPYLKDAELPAEFWADVARYSPFPNELATKMATAIAKAGQEPPDPMAVAAQQAQLAEQQGEAAKVAADAKKTGAEAITALAEAAVSSAQAGALFPADQLAFGEIGT